MPRRTSSDAARKAAEPVPQHVDLLPRLKRARGQVDGVERMIEAGRWCPDIILQLRAAQAALKVVELAILDRYLGRCVVRIAQGEDEAAQRQVIAELSALLRRKG